METNELVLKTRVDQLGTDVDDLDTRVDQLGTDVDDLDERVTILEQGPAPTGPTSVGFSVMLNGDSTEEIISLGPLTGFIRCSKNDDGKDKVEMVFTSTEDGWFARQNTIGHEAGVNVVMRFRSVATNGPDFNADYNQDAVVSGTGEFVGILSTAFGLNILGVDCVAIGTLSTMP